MIFISLKHFAPISALIIITIKMQTDDKSIYHFNKIFYLKRKTQFSTNSTFGINMAFVRNLGKILNKCHFLY